MVSDRKMTGTTQTIYRGNFESFFLLTVYFVSLVWKARICYSVIAELLKRFMKYFFYQHQKVGIWLKCRFDKGHVSYTCTGAHLISKWWLSPVGQWLFYFLFPTYYTWWYPLIIWTWHLEVLSAEIRKYRESADRSKKTFFFFLHQKNPFG